MGWTRKASPDYALGLLMLAAGLVLEALLVLSLRLPRRARADKAAAAQLTSDGVCSNDVLPTRPARNPPGAQS